MTPVEQNLEASSPTRLDLQTPDSGTTNGADFYSRYAVAVYLASLAAAFWIWIRPIGTPLWLDETFSYWQIQGGISEIWSRSSGWPCSPIYPYILWLTEKIAGNQEIALRIPSVLAMAGAAYFLYRTGKLLFGREVGLIAAIFFSAYPSVAFSAIDARSYAFAMLALTVASFLLVELTREGRTRDAILFGAACAAVLYFQYLYAVVFPAFLIYYFVIKRKQLASAPRELGIAAASFLAFTAPLIPHVLSVIRAQDTHSFSEAPTFFSILPQLAPAPMATVVLWTTLLAVVISRVRRWEEQEMPGVVLGAAAALVPILILYDVSVSTSMHVFVGRYLLVAVPAVALIWAWLLSFVTSRIVRQAAVVVLLIAAIYHANNLSQQHGYTWKEAIQVARQSVAKDNAPILMCSDYVESNTHTLPKSPVTESAFVSQVSYYKIGAPVTVLPRELTEYSKLTISSFLQGEGSRRRFVVLAFAPSYPTVRWIKEQTLSTHTAQLLGVYDNIVVVEFLPR